MLEELNCKVVSYCEIPQEITEETWLSEGAPDAYYTYTLEPKGYSELSDWIRNKYPELEGKEFLIHCDY